MNKLYLSVISTILFIGIAGASGMVTISVMDQYKTDYSITGGAIALKSTSTIISQALEYEDIDKALNLYPSVDATVRNIDGLINKAIIGMYSDASVKIFARVNNSNKKLAVLIEELAKNEEEIKRQQQTKVEMTETIKKLINLSSLISQRAVKEDLSKSQLYYVATQEARLRRILDTLNEKDSNSIQARNEKIKRLINDYVNVISQLKDGFNNSQAGKIKDINTRKLIHLNEKSMNNLLGLIEDPVKDTIKAVFESSIDESNRLAEDSARLASTLSIENKNRTLNIELLIVLIITAVAMLIASVTCWYLYIQENTRLDSQRIKAERIAFRNLNKNLKKLQEGNIATKIDKSNPYTKDISTALSEVFTRLANTVGVVKTHINEAEESVEVSEKIKMDMEIQSQKLIENERKTNSAVNSFKKQHQDIKVAFDNLPKRLQAQQEMIKTIINTVSNNYMLAQSLTKRSREISEKFKSQSEKSQSIQSAASGINKYSNEINSLLINIQVASEDDIEKIANELARLGEKLQAESNDLSISADVLVESSSNNQTIIEDIRDDITSLNNIAKESSEQGKSLLSESSGLGEHVAAFIKSADMFTGLIESISEQSKETSSTISKQTELSKSALFTINKLSKAMSKINEDLMEYKV